jgi:hypothetical protein
MKRALALLLLVSLGLHAQTLAISHVTVIDTNGGPPLRDVTASCGPRSRSAATDQIPARQSV